MNLDDSIDLAVFIASIAAIGVGVGFALSLAWAVAAVGGLLAVAVLAERFTMRLARTQKGKPDEPA
jgi:hypothetical protein